MNDNQNNYFSGLDLFKDPFCSSRPASGQPKSYSRPSSSSRSVAASHPKPATTQPQSNHQATQPEPPKPITAQAQQSNTVAKKSITPVEAPAPQAKVPVQSQKETPTPVKPSAPVDSQKSETPKKALELDMSYSGTPTTRKSTTADDAAKRKAHEEAEAKRKAEWDAKQAAKKQAEEEALKKLQVMSDDDVIAASIKRVSTDVERITRRNMKECVAAHIQELARKDPDLAKRTLHPRKSMINCFKYINRMAKDYVKQEMEDNDIKPDSDGYGCDVPDGTVYQWAVDYFNDLDAQEDRVKEEKFTPRPYVAKSPSKPPSKATKAQKKTKAKENKKEPEQKDDYKQMSLF